MNFVVMKMKKMRIKFWKEMRIKFWMKVVLKKILRFKNKKEKM